MSSAPPYVPKNPYVALNDVVEELKLNAADVAADPVLTNELLAAIDRASRWVDEYTRRDYIFHDFSVTPIAYDQFTPGVYGKEIFFDKKPILTINSLILGKAPTDSCAVTLTLNEDYWYDQNRIYMLDASRFFIQTVDIPRDGAHALGKRDRGWNLYRPDRILFVYGQSGFVQGSVFQMTAAGPGAAQTAGWTISSYAAPTTLYWTIQQTTPGVVTINVYSDPGQIILVAQGTGTTAGSQTISLSPVNGTSYGGQVSFNYSADSLTGNTIVQTPNTAATIDTTTIPQGLESRITTATRLVAACFSGHNRKEVVGLDGSKKDIADREIPPTVFKLLGRRMPILV